MLAQHKQKWSLLSQWLVLVASLSLAGSHGCGAGAESYRGDGRARSGASWMNPALIIEFDEFSLDADYHAEYRIDRMPSLRRNAMRFGIATVQQPPNGVGSPWWAGASNLGTLRFTVMGNNGRTLLDCETEVGELSWDRFDGDSAFGTRFVGPCPTKLVDRELESGEPRSVKVHYVSGQQSPSEAVRVRIQAGGTIHLP